jgi:hypothetical protein
MEVDKPEESKESKKRFEVKKVRSASNPSNHFHPTFVRLRSGTPYRYGRGVSRFRLLSNDGQINFSSNSQTLWSTIVPSAGTTSWIFVRCSACNLRDVLLR